MQMSGEYSVRIDFDLLYWRTFISKDSPPPVQSGLLLRQIRFQPGFLLADCPLAPVKPIYARECGKSTTDGSGSITEGLELLEISITFVHVCG